MAANKDVELLPRRGACSDVDQNSGKAYVFRGYNDENSDYRHRRLQYEESVSVYDFITEKWSKECFTDTTHSPPFSIGACCTIIDNNMIVFGGWDEGYLHNNVHKLDLSTMKWVELIPEVGGASEPILKNKARMIAYGNDMVFIFGGYGYPLRGKPLQKGAQYDWDRQIVPGLEIGWTNEQHLFHLRDRKWVEPHTTGTRPPPCAAFSINRIDPFRVVIFGGRQKQERVNELHILDMNSWHWSGVILPTDPLLPWPSKRSFNAAVCLYNPDYVPVPVDDKDKHEFDWLPCPPPSLVTNETVNIIKEQQLLVLFGMDNNGDPSPDMAWVLYTGSLTWKQVELPKGCVPRLWHTSDVHYVTPLHCKVMTHGGVTENLFAKPDEHVATTNHTLLLEYGMKTLYRLCQESVVRFVEDVERLRPLLPQHVVEQLLRERMLIQ